MGGRLLAKMIVRNLGSISPMSKSETGTSDAVRAPPEEARELWLAPNGAGNVECHQHIERRDWQLLRLLRA